MFAQLAQHKIIGWDIDETLVNNPFAGPLHTFIEDHPEIRHVLITYRTDPADVGNIERDIELGRKGLFRRFAGVSTCPPSIFKAFIDNQADPVAAQRFWGWKPRVCRHVGATALVDDLIHIKPHCGEDVHYFHPDYFKPKGKPAIIRDYSWIKETP